MNQPSATDSGIQKARTLMRAREYPKAISLLQNLLEKDSSDEDLMELLGMACFFARDFDKARDAFEVLTRHNPGHTKAWVNLGAVLNRQGEYKKAIEALRRAVQKDRRCAEGYYNMGIAQKGLNLLTMAISAYKEAIKLKPDLVDAHINLGNIYAEMKNLGLAQKCFTEALRHDPQSKKAQSCLDKIHATQKVVKKEASPFGRLVNVEELDRQSKSSGPRIMDAMARQAERDLVQAVTKKIRPSAKEIVPLLQESLHSQLHRLERIVLQTENRLSSSEQLEFFEQTVSDLHRMKTVINDGLAELREHLSGNGP